MLCLCSIKPDGQVKVWAPLHKGDEFWNSERVPFHIPTTSTNGSSGGGN